MVKKYQKKEIEIMKKSLKKAKLQNYICVMIVGGDFANMQLQEINHTTHKQEGDK